MVISVPFGVYGIALGTVISTAFSAIVNMYPNRKLLDYTYTEQFLDVFPSLIISSLMGIFVYAIGFLKLGVNLTLTLQIIIGIGSYIILSKAFGVESYRYLVNNKGIQD